MLIEIAIGDAYGAAFEFAPKNFISTHNKLKYYKEHHLDSIQPGFYTDDTQMSIATTELILEHQYWSKKIIAEKFITVFKRDPRITYAKGFLKLLNSCENGLDLLKKIKPESTRNGCVMRAVPLGIIKNIHELKIKSKLHTVITHNNQTSIISSQAISLAAHYFIYKNNNLKSMLNFINRELNISIDTNKKTKTECDAVDTVNSVMTVLSKSNTLSEILYFSVDLGGDTDSVASIALGLGSLNKNYINDLPKFLYNNLENKKYGKDFLITLDKKIKSMKT